MKFAMCVLGAVSMITVVPVTDIVSSVVDTTPSCEKVRAWQEERGATVVVSFDDTVAYPMEYRRRLIRSSSAENQSVLWHEHFQRFRSARQTPLTPEQERVLQQAEQLAVPETFRTPQSAAVRQELSILSEGARTAFGQGVAKKLLTQIGPDRGSYRHWDAARLTLASAIRGQFVAAAYPDCDCSVDSDWCSPWPTSPTSVCDTRDQCNVQLDECGTFGTFDCDGRCRPDL